MARGGSRAGAGRKRIDGARNQSVSIRVTESDKSFLQTTTWNWRQDFLKMVERKLLDTK